MTEFEELVALCKAGVMLCANDHKLNYQSVEDYFSDCRFANEELPPEVMREMVATDTVYCLQFYPDTPIGSYALYDSQVGRLLKAGIALMKEHGGD